MAFVDTQVRPQGEQADVVAPTKLKLSAAIRIGAKMSPPGNKNAWRDACGGTCAVMAACEALFGKKWDGYDPAEKLMRHFGISRDEWHSRTYQLSMRYAQGESREQIADILESQGL